MPHAGFLVFFLLTIACGFWLSQIARVLTAEESTFEDHKHRLLWFIVVVWCPLVGAIWFYVWLRQTAVRREQEKALSSVLKIADEFKLKKNPEPE